MEDEYLLIVTIEKTYGEDSTVSQFVLKVPKHLPPDKGLNEWFSDFWGSKTRKEDDHYVRDDGTASIRVRSVREVQPADESVISRYFDVYEIYFFWGVINGRYKV